MRSRPWSISRRPWLPTLGCALILLSVVVGAVPASASDLPVVASDGTSRGKLQAQFTAAAREFHVPVAVLLAVGYEGSRWESHGGLPSVAGGFGAMNLTDVTAVRAGADAGGDARGKGGPAVGNRGPAAVRDSPREVRSAEANAETLPAAAALLGVAAARLRREPGQNIRGAAALLADWQRALTGELPADAGAWYPAVARYNGSPDVAGARSYADDVYTLIRTGVTRMTFEGQRVRLTANPTVRPDRAALARLRLAQVPAGHAGSPECPRDLGCDVVPAAYAQTDQADPRRYGNYDLADRPRDGDRVRFIVIHDTEISYGATLRSYADPTTAVSAHYLIRSRDGHVTQAVPTRDVAWHAGNWYVNAHAIGIEHEGVAAEGGAWYSESLYRSSARLVRYLAARYHIPLDRAHIIGHDTVPAPDPAHLAGMHWDPGPYWDWDHYMELVGSAPPKTGTSHSAMVRISPSYGSNRPALTMCDRGGCRPLPSQPASFVYLRTRPTEDAPLLADPALRRGKPGTTRLDDLGDKAASGQRFVVAQRRAGWTAIWYGGRTAWYRDPNGINSAAAHGRFVRPRAGRRSIPVYGRAYPEAAAFPSTIPVQPVVPLPYTIPAGQAYPTQPCVRGDYYNATTFDGSQPGERTLVRGHDRYLPIQFNHRLAFVRAADVTVENK